MKMMKNHTMLKMINNSLIDLPTPANISNWWNFGSMLGICLTLQIITGLFLTMHFCPNVLMAFDSISHIYRNVNNGWIIRIIHANGASMFFICLYMHVGRGLYYSSYLLKETWTTGVMIFFLTMMTAFLGYVLPWGQMSFWAATVITNLLSAIPIVGTTLVQWLWGSYAIENATLNRFFTFHFFLPFMIIAMVMMHLIFLHQSGSTNPLGTNSNINKIPFHPYFTIKDMLWFTVMIFIILLISLISPFMLTDPENFIPANPLMTPNHIKPEWYFLYMYAILRSIPNKLGGVVALIASILILLVMPMMSKSMQSNKFYPINKICFWTFISTTMILTWIGAQPVEEPFITIGQSLTYIYFMFFPLNFFLYKLWDKTMKM